MKTDQGEEGSRFARHLSLLGLSDEPMEGAALDAERAFVDSMPTKNLSFPDEVLRLPQRKKNNIWWAASGVILAAALALLVLRQPSDNDNGLIIKGGSHVEVFVEQDGKIQKLPEAGTVASGARLKAEISAQRNAMAFWGVHNSGGQLLTDAAWIWQNRLELKTSERKSFSGSLELQGASEGERLCVLECPADVAKRGQDRLTREIAEILRSETLNGNDYATCKLQCSQLRN